MLNGDEDEEFSAFVALHAAALQSAGIPHIYWRSLHHKITNEVSVLQIESEPLTLACSVCRCDF